MMMWYLQRQVNQMCFSVTGQCGGENEEQPAGDVEIAEEAEENKGYCGPCLRTSGCSKAEVENDENDIENGNSPPFEPKEIIYELTPDPEFEDQSYMAKAMRFICCKRPKVPVIDQHGFSIDSPGFLDAVETVNSMQHVTDEHRRFVKKLFRKFDEDKDGNFSADELANAVSFNKKYKEKLIEYFGDDILIQFRKRDTDGSGGLDEGEFIAWVRDVNWKKKMSHVVFNYCNAQEKETIHRDQIFYLWKKYELAIANLLGANVVRELKLQKKTDLTEAELINWFINAGN